MPSTTFREQLGEYFGDDLASDEKLVEECFTMCQIFNLSAEDLFYKWEASRFNSANIRSFASLTLESAKMLRSQLQREITSTNNKSSNTKTSVTSSVRRDGVFPSGMSTKPRPDILVGSKTNVASGLAGPSNVSFKGPKNDLMSRNNRAFRYMYEKISERSEALDDRIDELAELIRDHYNIPDLGDPASSTENDIIVVGRITVDPDLSSGAVKLTHGSIALASSRMMGSGTIVPLRFDHQVIIRGGVKGAGGIGLFPGAMVALSGKNGGGGWFLVNEIIVMPGMKPRPEPIRTLQVANSSFSMYIASGPYTPDTDLQHKPWQKLLDVMKSTKPTVVLLLGPFIDSTHPILKNGDTDQTPVQIFREQFSAKLRDLLDVSPNILVLLVPSCRDMVANHATYPQCELGPDCASDRRVLLLPNPCRFSINNVSFAVTTVDVLFHLRKEELFIRGKEADSEQPPPDDPGNDAMANLCRQLLQQRSFYPLFPVPLSLSHEVNLDVSHSDGLKLCDAEDEYAPDVFILPSRLKSFSKAVYSTRAVNPSHLTKGQYATLNFRENSASVEVDIVKL